MQNKTARTLLCFAFGSEKNSSDQIIEAICPENHDVHNQQPDGLFLPVEFTVMHSRRAMASFCPSRILSHAHRSIVRFAGRDKDIDLIRRALPAETVKVVSRHRAEGNFVSEATLALAHPTTVQKPARTFA